MNRLILFLLIFSVFVDSHIHALEDSDHVGSIQAGIESGLIAFRLTEPGEMLDLLGKPQNEETRNDGGMVIRILHYPEVTAVFGKMRKDTAPFTLLRLLAGEEDLNIGRNKKIVLRNMKDLVKIDRFTGFQNISLACLDLHEKMELLEITVFDTLTEWPPAERLPEGFDPIQRLSEGMKQGLDLDTLHELEIDGRGVHAAVIDQPLLLGHEAYSHAIVRYDATDLEKYDPQMHGSPICGILAGIDSGVAPGVQISYFAVPMWVRDNGPYISAMKKILALNEEAASEDRIRVVSLSDGSFANKKHYDEWLAVRDQAEKNGVLVVTCDSKFLEYGTLNRIPGTDPNDPENYELGKYGMPGDKVLIPTGHITVASHRGEDVYTYEIDGGMSWAAPYIAGLAALAFQVNPALEPKEIITFLKESASPTQAGPVVNPMEFIKRSRP